MKRLLFLLACSACVDTAGPFVHDVTPLADGSIRVRSCYVEFHRGFVVASSLSDGDCSTKIVRVR